jgi:HEPN domain-containing protein
MRRQRYDPDDPREWLNRAHSSLEHARKAAPGIYFEDLCFSAQQAAEKAVKAVFIHLREPFPYTHNLGNLLALLSRKGIEIPPAVARADELSPFAFGARYPGLGLETAEEEYYGLLEIAESVVGWAEHIVLGKGED